MAKEFGLPNFIGVDPGLGFWSIGAVSAEKSWRWTGYSYHGWKILQGNDPDVTYLVPDENQSVAFKYMFYFCI